MSLLVIIILFDNVYGVYMMTLYLIEFIQVFYLTDLTIQMGDRQLSGAMYFPSSLLYSLKVIARRSHTQTHTHFQRKKNYNSRAYQFIFDDCVDI